MGLGHYLFGYSGRINRAKQWAGLLVGIVFLCLFWALFGATVGFTAIADMMQKKTTAAALFGSQAFHTFLLAACVLYLLNLYVAFAIMTKRLHDRNKSAWWILVFIVLPFILQIPAFAALPAQLAHFQAVMAALQAHMPPPPPVETPLVLIGRAAALIISLWMFVELYILRGTVGDNRFGPDPLAGRG
ncbi:MAG: DUF805 domain-containing protein [Rhizomicrobium sp.]